MSRSLLQGVYAVVEDPLLVDDILVDDLGKGDLDSSELFLTICGCNLLHGFTPLGDVFLLFEGCLMPCVLLHVVHDIVGTHHSVSIWLLHAIEVFCVGEAGHADFIPLHALFSNGTSP